MAKGSCKKLKGGIGEREKRKISPRIMIRTEEKGQRGEWLEAGDAWQDSV
jgi:hypothetical protein